MGEIFNNDENTEAMNSIPSKGKGILSSPFVKIFLFSIIIIIIISGLMFFLFKGVGPKQPNKSSLSTSQNFQGMDANQQKQLENEIAKLKNDIKEQEEKKRNQKPLKIEYEPLYENVDAAQTEAILQELSISGISFSTKQKGKYYDISVDKDKYEESKNILAVRGLPSGGIKGYELFDKSDNLGVTEFDKKIRFVRAISGELEKAIMQFSAIEYCQVQIVLPEQKFFSTKQPPVTASILVRKKRGLVKIKPETVIAIIKLVANSVEDLKPENITVVDTDGIVISKDLVKERPKTEQEQIEIESADNDLGINVSTEEKAILLATSPSSNFAINSLENQQTLATSEKAVIAPVSNELQGLSTKTVNVEPKNYPASDVSLKSPQKIQTSSQEIIISSANNQPDNKAVMDDIKKHNEIRSNLRNILELKINKRLEDLLPKGNYFVLVDLNVNKFFKDFPVIESINVVVNLNKNNSLISLTPDIKGRIFQTIISILPYKKKRDTINLAWSSDFPASTIITGTNNLTVSPNFIGSTKIKKIPLFIYQLNRLKNKYFEFFVLAIALVLILCLFLFLGYRFFRKPKLGVKTNEQEQETALSTERTVLEELNQEKKDFDANLEKLQFLAINHPDVLAEIVEDLLNNPVEVKEEVVS